MGKIFKTVLVALVALILVGGAFYYFSSMENGTSGTDTITDIRRQFTPNPTNETPSTPQETEGFVRDAEQARLPSVSSAQNVWENAVAGAIFVDNATIRFVERATGHIYDVDLATGQSEFISNTTIPQVYQAIWFDENSLALQYVREGTDSAETFVGSISDTVGTTTDTLSGSFLPSNIASLTYNNGYVYYVANGNIYKASIETGQSEILHSSQISSWTIFPHTNAELYVQTAPSYGVEGALFELSESGQLSTILNGKSGLTTLPGSEHLLYRDSGGLSVLTFTSRQSSSFNANVIPEKCVWSSIEQNTVYCAVPENVPVTFPDSWYQGETVFVDSIQRLNVVGATADTLFDSSRGAFDAVELALSPDEQRLSFIDNSTRLLWVVETGALVDEPQSPDQS